MNSIVPFYVIFALFFGEYTYDCLQLIPVIPRITYTNKRYMEDLSASVRKYNRKGDYVLNLNFTNIVPYNNNVTIHIIFYEYLHNEYRPSFIELKFKLCDLILKEPLLSAVINKAGITTCPLLPGLKELKNMTYNQDIPSVWPFEKGRAELMAMCTSTKELIAKGDLVFVIKQKLQSGK